MGVTETQQVLGSRRLGEGSWIKRGDNDIDHGERRASDPVACDDACDVEGPGRPAMAKNVETDGEAEQGTAE